MSRSARKRSAIVAAALQVFLEDGFDRATMDDIAARAGASKVTVYQHFADKQRLWLAVITDAIEHTATGTNRQIEGLGDSTNLTRDLRAFARAHVIQVVSPTVIAMRRMIIAEAIRFPELAAAWHAAGPVSAHNQIAEQLRRLNHRGMLRAPDPKLAAETLNYLILSVPLNEAMFLPAHRLSTRRLHRYADEGVRVFLAGYACDPSAIGE